MQKSFAFILSSVVQKHGIYSRHSSSSYTKLRLPATQDVWLASPAVKLMRQKGRE